MVFKTMYTMVYGTMHTFGGSRNHVYYGVWNHVYLTMVYKTMYIYFGIPNIMLFVVVLALTHRHNAMQSVVAEQAPITLEWKKYLGKKI